MGRGRWSHRYPLTVGERRGPGVTANQLGRLRQQPEVIGLRRAGYGMISWPTAHSSRNECDLRNIDNDFRMAVPENLIGWQRRDKRDAPAARPDRAGFKWATTDGPKTAEALRRPRGQHQMALPYVRSEYPGGSSLSRDGGARTGPCRSAVPSTAMLAGSGNRRGVRRVVVIQLETSHPQTWRHYKLHCRHRPR